MMHKLFLDESGYTGQNLLDDAQPVFILASHDLTKAECLRLFSRHFGKLKSIELKHSALSKRPSHQRHLIELLREVISNPKRINCARFHKAFALVSKIVDFIAEPVYRGGGIDLYDRGINIATANVFFYVVPALSSKQSQQEVLTSFQEFVLHPDVSSSDKFFDAVEQVCEQSIQLREFLAPVVFARALFKGNPARWFPKDPLDLAITGTFVLMDLWQRQIGKPIQLIHDRSSIMARHKRLWKAVVDPSIPANIVGYDRRKMHFPVRVAKTVSGNSKVHPGLQLADLMAGSLRKAHQWFMNGEPKDDTYGRDVFELYFHSEFALFSMWPSKDVTPKALDTTGPNAGDPLDFLEGLITSKK